MEPFIIQKPALLFQGWHPNCQKWWKNFKVDALKFNIDCPLTSIASKMALSYISKIASNRWICSKDWWEVSIVGRNCKKTQKSSAVTSFTNSYSFYREECSTKGGASDGSCASGFGVCCVCKYLKARPCPFIHISPIFYPRCIIGWYNYYLSVALACGASASENQTYLVQASVTTLTNPCKYTICPCGTNICRIRFDFTVRILKMSKYFLF